ncbi:hypothetical protein [Roseomonas sp. KE2513]|uniref:hypothetical protein n=1 Tax=Roseomonas sp. KE2513 TaxID=2479202 RepID=UPI0018DF3D31|nr:hypothetical protein [Roseomonas sp. KE2513]
MFGIDALTGLALLISLCGFIPVAMAFAEDPSVLRAGGSRPGARLVGFLAGPPR